MFEGHSDAVYCVDFSPVDDSLLVSGSLDRSLRLWKFVANGVSSCLKAISGGHNDFVLSVVFTPDGKYIISGGKDRSINVWSVTTHEQVLTLTGHFNSGTTTSNDFVYSDLFGSYRGNVCQWFWG